jgi:hypothetical protein
MLPGELFQWLSLSQKTGTLVVTTERVEKKIFFKAGRILSSASNDPREYLGQFLMSHGYLTEPELKKAMEVQRQSNILLGKILVTIGVISEQDLRRLMRLKAEEEIYDVFLWPDGRFEFIDGELPKMEMIPLQVDVTGIIMEGTRRVDEWSRIRELIPNDLMIPLVVQPVGDEFVNDEVKGTIIRAVDGKRTIADIVVESRSSEFQVSSTLHTLIRKGAVRLTDPSEQKAAAVAADKAAEPVARQLTEDEEIASLIERAQQAIRGGDFEKAQRLLRAAQGLDPNNARVRTAIKGAETLIINELRQAGVSDAKVPQVSKSLDEITGMNFSPNEGFLLSRINGTWDIGSLVKISPIREPDALLIFYKLWKDGIITLD